MSLLEIYLLKNGFKFSLLIFFDCLIIIRLCTDLFKFIPEGLVQCSCVIISFESLKSLFLQISFWSGSFMFILTYQMVNYSFWGFINFYLFLSFFQLDHFLLYVMLFLAHSQWFCLFKEQDFRISVTCHFCWHHLLTQFWL